MAICFLITGLTGNRQTRRSVNLTVRAILEGLGYIDSCTLDVCNCFRSAIVAVREVINRTEHASSKFEVTGPIFRRNSCSVIRKVNGAVILIELNRSIVTGRTVLTTLWKVIDRCRPVVIGIQFERYVLECRPVVGIIRIIIVLDLECNRCPTICG